MSPSCFRHQETESLDNITQNAGQVGTDPTSLVSRLFAPFLDTPIHPTKVRQPPRVTPPRTPFADQAHTKCLRRCQRVRERFHPVAPNYVTNYRLPNQQFGSPRRRDTVRPVLGVYSTCTLSRASLQISQPQTSTACNSMLQVTSDPFYDGVGIYGNHITQTKRQCHCGKTIVNARRLEDHMH